MRHITVGEKSLITGNSVTDLLIRYATLLTRQHSGDSVEFKAYDSAGTGTTVTVLLNGGLSLVAQEVPSDIEEPDNGAAEASLRARIDDLTKQQAPSYDEIAGTSIWNAER